MFEFAMGGKDKLTLKVKPFRDKRSLQANKYFWALVEKISNLLRESQDVIYLKMLTKYGQTDEDGDGNKIIFSMQSHIKPTKALGHLAITGTASLYNEDKKKYIEFTHYRALKGSSEFDSKEMAILIDGIVSDCKELGIQTETPQELARMCEEWNK